MNTLCSSINILYLQSSVWMRYFQQDPVLAGWQMSCDRHRKKIINTCRGMKRLLTMQPTCLSVAAQLTRVGTTAHRRIIFWKSTNMVVSINTQFEYVQITLLMIGFNLIVEIKLVGRFSKKTKFTQQKNITSKISLKFHV